MIGGVKKKYLKISIVLQKRENNRLTDEIKCLNREKEHLQSQVAKMLKKEDKMKHDHENNIVKLKEAESDVSLMNAQIGT